MPTYEQLTYRASTPLARAASILVESDAHPEQAWVQRTKTTRGRTLWRWTGGRVGAFAIEDEGNQASFLATRDDGAPFGRIRVRGWLRVRLEATDARAVTIVGEPDGRLRTAEGKQVGRLEVRSPNEIVVSLAPVEDETRRVLALAMPICQAATAPLLLA